MKKMKKAVADVEEVFVVVKNKTLGLRIAVVSVIVLVTLIVKVFVSNF